MADISTTYLGLSLKSPIIVSAGPLTEDLDSLKKLEEAGAGAVVLKSIFEEQIESDVQKNSAEDDNNLNFPTAESHYVDFDRNNYINRYMRLLVEAKKTLSIPVIASVCCKTEEGWTDYVGRFIACGADAIELNYYPIASNSRVDGREVEKKLFEFAKEARKDIPIGLSLKISHKYSSLANVIKELEKRKVDGLVLFNRFFMPDININAMSFVPGPPTSDAHDYSDTLRWIGLMAGEVSIDLCANTGIHNWQTVVKMLLAGAAAVEVCSVLIKEGIDSIKRMNEGLTLWMDKNNFSKIADFKALMAQENNAAGYAWERTQFLKMIKDDRS